MAPLFKSTAYLLLLLVILLPNRGDSSMLGFGSSKPPALVENNQYSQISVPGSSGTVRNNQYTSVNADKAELDVQNNQHCHLTFHGGSLKLHGSQHSVVTGNDNDFDMSGCQHATISGQNNKGIFWGSQHLSVAGKDNDFYVSGSQHSSLFGERNKVTCQYSQHLSSEGHDNKLTFETSAHIHVKSSSNKMTIFAKDSQSVSIQDSSNSQVKMTRVKSVKVSGKDFTLEGTDIKHHAFLGKSCSGNKITHKVAFLPSEDKKCGHFFSKLRSAFSNFNGGTININGGTITVNGVTVNSNSDCGEDFLPISLEFCNTLKVSGPTYEIGGLPSLTIEIEEKKKTAVIRMSRTNGKDECKIVSEDGKMMVSISALSEELLIEGAKEIRRVDDGKCEFVLSLGKDDAKVSTSDSAGETGDGVTEEDKDEDKNNMLSPLFDVGKGALDLALSYFHNFFW